MVPATREKLGPGVNDSLRAQALIRLPISSAAVISRRDAPRIGLGRHAAGLVAALNCNYLIISKDTVLFFLIAIALGLRVFAGAPEFESNRGRAGSGFAFLTRVGGTQTYIAESSIDFAPPNGAGVSLSWRNTGQSAWRAHQPTGNTIRYCNLNVPSLCAEGVATYRRVERKGLYPGIDWIIHSHNDELEYDLVIHPGADPRQIRLRIDGPAASIDKDGRLHAGPLIQWRPEAYQWINGSRHSVRAAFHTIAANEFSFDLGDYDPTVDLTIDPVIQIAQVEGGTEDDRLLGTLGDFRYGTTRSAIWGRPANRHDSDVFIRYSSVGRTTTVFWGGEGDEEIGGADFEANNAILNLAGWTNSTQATLIGASGQSPREYGGGTSDGFLLEFRRGTLAFASFYGGPGADRLYDVRRTSPVGYPAPSYLIAGETDSLDWTRASFTRLGPGGKTDAIAGTVNGSQLDLLAIGGAANDRAMRVRATAGDVWAVAGESDSADFPSMGGAPFAGGRDLWIGRVRFPKNDVVTLRLWGGSGVEQFGGLGSISGQSPTGRLCRSPALIRRS